MDGWLSSNTIIPEVLALARVGSVNLALAKRTWLKKIARYHMRIAELEQALAERDARIAAHEQTIATLQETVATLLARIQELEDRLNRNSGNCASRSSNQFQCTR